MARSVIGAVSTYLVTLASVVAALAFCAHWQLEFVITRLAVTACSVAGTPTLSTILCAVVTVGPILARKVAERMTFVTSVAQPRAVSSRLITHSVIGTMTAGITYTSVTVVTGSAAIGTMTAVGLTNLVVSTVTTLLSAVLSVVTFSTSPHLHFTGYDEIILLVAKGVEEIFVSFKFDNSSLDRVCACKMVNIDKRDVLGDAVTQCIIHVDANSLQVSVISFLLDGALPVNGQR